MQPEAVGAPGCCWFQLAVKYLLPGLLPAATVAVGRIESFNISSVCHFDRRLSIRLALNLTAYRIRHGRESSAIAVPQPSA